MESVRNKIKKAVKEERGFAIVEATIVFPVMFFVLFFIIYIGNAYYQIAQVDSCVMRAAIRGSQYVSDPQQYTMATSGVFPKEIDDVEPYRYILGLVPGGSLRDVEDIVEEEVRKQVGECQCFFMDMKPMITTGNGKIAKFNNYVLYSTFTVDVSYEVKFPIRFLGKEAPTILELSSCAEVSVNDSAEFIRNVDMVVDLTANTKVGKAISSLFSKVNYYINNFANK